MFDQSTIPLRKLDRSRPHRFDYQPNQATLDEMAAQNDWRKVKIDAFKGELSPLDDGWALDGQITGLLTQNCVISGAPVKYPLNIHVKRQYLLNMPDLPKDFTIEEEFDVNIEPAPQSLDLDALINEEILLDAPEYPRLKEYQDDRIWEFSPLNEDEILEERKTSPFADLDKRLSSKE